MTVKQLIYLEKISSGSKDDVEKLAYSISFLFDLTFNEVNNLTPDKFSRLSKKLAKRINVNPYPIKINRFQTDATKITFGQFIECQEWLKSEKETKLHMIAASILKKRGDHKRDSERMLRMNIRSVIPYTNLFTNSFEKLILSYKYLFEIDKEDEGIEIKKKNHPFLTNFGWVFTAKEVATHLGISLNQAFDIGVIEALNTAAYLKSKQKYEQWAAKQ